MKSISLTPKDDAIFIAASFPVAVIVIYLLRVTWLGGPLSMMKARIRQIANALPSSRSSPVDEVARITQEKMRVQKVQQFRRLSQALSFVIMIFTVHMMFLIATRQERSATLAMDILHLVAQSSLSVTLLCPHLVSDRTMDGFFLFWGLSLALYISPWVCHPDYLFDSLAVANFGAILLTTVRRSVLPCMCVNAMVAVSACCLIWVNEGGCVMRPFTMMFLQVLSTALLMGCNQVLDKSIGSMIRQSLEIQAAREVLSAVSSLLRSCCDIVVELDSKGAIVGPATDLSSFLLRGHKNLRGTRFLDLMVSEEDRAYCAHSLRGEPWSSSKGVADVRHVHMKDGNANILKLELLWFQYRHLDQQLRYMVGLRDFADTPLKAPRGAAPGAPADAEAPRGAAPGAPVDAEAADPTLPMAAQGAPADAAASDCEPWLPAAQPCPRCHGPPPEDPPEPSAGRLQPQRGARSQPSAARGSSDRGSSLGSSDRGSSSIPEGALVTSFTSEAPAYVVVDSLQRELPVRECSDEFCKRIGRLNTGQSLTATLTNGRQTFVKWLQVSITRLAYKQDAPPDKRVVFKMPQGEMTATCRLMHSLDADGSEDGSEGSFDLTLVRLCVSNIKRRCSGNTRSGGSTPPDRNHYRGTPVTRMAV